MDSILPDDSAGNLIPESTFIYRLRDPETQEIRYVGKANNPEDRLKQHIAHSQNQAKGTHAGYWIASLRKRGLTPLLEIIEEVPFSLWQERELYWINHYLQLGHPLTNTYFGGVGVGMVPPEVRAKMAASHTGKKVPREVVEKSAASRRGRTLSPEQKAKLSAAKAGKPGPPQSPESRAKVSASKVGKKREPFSEEWRRKLGDVTRGKKQSPEHIAKRAVARRGKPLSAEQRANVSLGKKRANAIRNNPPNAPTLWD